MPIHNAGSVPPRHATPPGAQQQNANKYHTLHFRTKDFERTIRSLPAEKKEFARLLFRKDATGKWMKTNQERLKAFTDILNPTEREALAKSIKERNFHLIPGSPLSAKAGLPQARRPAGETGSTPAPSSLHADAPARPGRQASAGTEAHSNPTSLDGTEPEAEKAKRPMSLGKKIALGVVALITLSFLATPVGEKDKEPPKKPE